jgi:hypothetical protein
VYGPNTTTQVIAVGHILGFEMEIDMINLISSCGIITPAISSDKIKRLSLKRMSYVINEYSSKHESRYNLAFAWMRLCVDYNKDSTMCESFRMKKNWFYKYGPHLPYGSKQILIQIQTLCNIASARKVSNLCKMAKRSCN